MFQIEPVNHQALTQDKTGAMQGRVNVWYFRCVLLWDPTSFTVTIFTVMIILMWDPTYPMFTCHFIIPAICLV